MRPTYFGSSARPLFGLHELPRTASRGGPAVLLCYPGVQEYNMAHWAFRRLSAMLAREGFHVLRFDWSGTGDSWGRTADGTLPVWLDDLTTAARELREASGLARISAVGMRLGAALVSLASSAGLELDHLVLWEPLVVGRRYVAELRSLNARENVRLLRSNRGPESELMGFPFPDTLKRAIEAIDLRATPPRAARRISVIAGSDRHDYRALFDAVRQSGANATFDCVPEDASATNVGQAEAAILANRSLAAIAERLLGRSPQ